MINLLLNVIFYVFDGDFDEFWIEILVKSEGLVVFIIVKDNGSGIVEDI